jgi:prophage regulatory protein
MTAKRFLRRPEVESKTGLSTSAIYAKMAANEFPKPIPLGKQSVGWLEESVDQWIDARIQAARGEPIHA